MGFQLFTDETDKSFPCLGILETAELWCWLKSSKFKISAPNQVIGPPTLIALQLDAGKTHTLINILEFLHSTLFMLLTGSQYPVLEDGTQIGILICIKLTFFFLHIILMFNLFGWLHNHIFVFSGRKQALPLYTSWKYIHASGVKQATFLWIFMMSPMTACLFKPFSCLIWIHGKC